MYKNSSKTAIVRTRPSAPVQWMLDNKIFRGRCIDWGSGRSFDFLHINNSPLVESCDTYDPYFSPERPTGLYDTIYCGYVANTLPPTYRAGLYMDILQFLGEAAYIVVRCDKVNGEPFEDGVITARGTFQKSYKIQEFQDELSEYFKNIYIRKFGHYLIAEVWN